MRNNTLIEYLHELTQAGYSVSFADDFPGMVQVTFKDPRGGYVRHEHLGHPNGGMELLEQKTIQSISRLLQEIKSDAVRYDGSPGKNGVRK